MSVRQIVAAVLGVAAATNVAHAQSTDFACPKAGTVEQRPVSTLTYAGASSSDPTICMVTNRVGKPELRLFNLYLLSDINNNAAALAPIKAGMSDLLSGRKTSATYPAMASNGYVETDTWTFVRKEPLKVEDKTFNTIVFDREITSDPRGRSAFHGHYTVWVDPKAGLWLKCELTGASGATNMYPLSYRDQKITGP
jgi:hypothetical protein